MLNFFEDLQKNYDRKDWLKTDPVQFLHCYSSKQDQEIVGFLSACFSYGSVALILRAIEKILAPMGNNPTKFVRNYKGSSAWPGFYHRFHKEPHLILLMLVLKDAVHEYGTLGHLFEKSVKDPKNPVESGLNGFVAHLHRRADEIAEQRGMLDAVSGVRFLINAPKGKSACKRMLMFLRWMVRKDEIDLGIWDFLEPKDLVVPTDTHVGRISFYLKLRGGKENQPPTWKMAREITESLKKINDLDPVRYDFGLARLGILDICKRQYLKSICRECAVRSVCRYGRDKT